MSTLCVNQKITRVCARSVCVLYSQQTVTGIEPVTETSPVCPQNALAPILDVVIGRRAPGMLTQSKPIVPAPSVPYPQHMDCWKEQS